jgi:hypothetical protein
MIRNTRLNSVVCLTALSAIVVLACSADAEPNANPRPWKGSAIGEGEFFDVTGDGGRRDRGQGPLPLPSMWKSRPPT